MVVDDRPDLHVLMVQRTSRAVFGPRAWVFPGGRVDAEDEHDLDAVTTGLDAGDASQMLDVEADGRAWWFAGLRETLEEAGLLIGAESAPTAAVEQTRDAVHADAGAFAPALLTNQIVLDLSAIHEVARFITPVGPPRRFDARFFVAQAPAGQIPHHDEEEVVRHAWVRPGEAMAAWDAGEFPLMSVTHRMLACLDRYPTVEPLLAAASERRPNARIRVNDPDGEYLVVLPGEPGYEEADSEVESGWVRI